MKLSSRHQTLALTIGAPSTGLGVSLDNHLWLFDQNSKITGNVPPLIFGPGGVAITEVLSPTRCDQANPGHYLTEMTRRD